MPVVAIDITISLVSYKSWLTTSFISSSLIGEDGKPLISDSELGPDRKDVFLNFFEEGAREVLKVFMSRQGDAGAVPFEISTTNVIYRFREEEPVLPQSNAIKNSLIEDVKNALFTYITYLWLKIKKNEEHATFVAERYEKLTKNIDNHLYKLHD